MPFTQRGVDMYISKITVRNFRSIESAELEFQNLNILVGLNDAGKSNFLRALNLFFNGETDHGAKFDFDSDYCHQPSSRSKKAKQITIRLEITPPSTYANSGKILWEKIWRREGLYRENQEFLNREKFQGNSKLPGWLRKMKYHYIPAIKSGGYFSKLMEEVYKTLKATAETHIKDASSTFIKEINDHTEAIGKNLESILGFNAVLQLPTDLSHIFSNLELASNSGDPNRLIGMNQRGDGVKVSHIPAILKFIDDQNNKNFDKGSIKSVTIWGYEEPENNLELTRCYEMAKNLSAYASNIQIVMTTHSPAFYMLRQRENTTCHFIEKPNQATIAKHINAENSIDNEMGLMPLIEPYVTAQIEEIDKLKFHIQHLKNELAASNLPRIYVEGETDEKLINHSLNKNHPDWKKLINVIVCKSANCVADRACAHILGSPKTPAIVIMDNDDAGRGAKEKIDAQKKRKQNCKLEIYLLGRHETQPDYILNIRKKSKMDIDIELEHCFGINVFEQGKAKNYLEQTRRPGHDLLDHKMNLLELYKEKGLTDDEVDLITHQVKQCHKNDFCKLIVEKGDFSFFDKFISDVVNHLKS